MTPKTIVNYKILKELGTGGMGTVYLAENISIGNKVAIKMLHPHLVKSENIKARFLKEAKTQANLNHPNITKVIDFVSNDQGLFIILEYVEGEALNDFLFKTKGLLPEKEANHYMAKILDAVAYAHSKSVVHRDLKSANIMVTPNKGIKIMDFGIAKLANETMSLTKTGSRLGSPLYMSPEQVTNGNVDFRSDIYSLGVVYHEMLTGTPVYDQNNTTEFEIYNKIVKQPLPRLKDFYKMNSEKAQDIVDTATAKLPAARFQSCLEFKNNLLNGAQTKQSAIPRFVEPIVEKQKLDKREKMVPQIASKKSNNSSVLIAVFIAIVLLGGGAFYFINNQGEIEKNEDLKLQIADNFINEGNYKKAYETYKTIIAEEPENSLVKEKLDNLESESMAFQQRSVDSVFQLYLQSASLENFNPRDSILAYKITSGYTHISDVLANLKENLKTVGEPAIINQYIAELETSNHYFEAINLYRMGNTEDALALLEAATLESQNPLLFQLKDSLGASFDIINGDGISINKTAVNTIIQFEKVQKPPLFPGCAATGTTSQNFCFRNNIKTFLDGKMSISKYQEMGLRSGTKTCNYSFVIGKDGIIKDILVTNAPSSIVERDLRNALQNIKGIKPGFQNYVPVEVKYGDSYVFEITNKPDRKSKPIQEEFVSENELIIDERPIPDYVSFEAADHYPIFPGCEGKTSVQLMVCTRDKINSFITDRNNYRSLEKLSSKLGLQKITVSFKIEKSGIISNINVRTPRTEVQSEVERVVASLPHMGTAYYNNLPVGVNYSMSFQLAVN